MTHSILSSYHKPSSQNHSPYHGTLHRDYFRRKHFLITLPLTAFFAVFFFGILFANLKWSDEVFWLGFQAENNLRQFEAGSLSISAFLIFLFKKRLIWWLLPAITIRLRRLGHLLFAVFSAWIGFAFGFFVTTIIRRFGILSFPLLFAILFPQIILYILSYGQLLKTMESRAHHAIPVEHATKNSYTDSPSRNAMPRASITGRCYTFLSFGIYLAGVFCEYALNPWLLEKIQIFLQ